jgi:hypothetical protein
MLCIVLTPAGLLDAEALTSGALAGVSVTTVDAALGASLLEDVSSPPQAPATVVMHAAKITDRRTILEA